MQHPNRKRLAPAILAWAVLGPGCGGPDADPGALGVRARGIINGAACDEQTHASSVALLIDGQIAIGFPGLPEMPPMPIRTVLCTGTLIAPDVVLTAAHCVDPSVLLGGLGSFKEASYYVSFQADLSALEMTADAIMGGTVPELPPDAVESSGRVANPGFKPELLQTFPGGLSNLYDVALVFLRTPVAEVEPAVVITAEEAAQVAVQREVRIAGWGQQTAARQDPFNPPPPGSVGKKFCATSSINAIGEHEMQIGAGPETARKCHGDSGGPSYMTVETEHQRTERVVGITSHAFDQTDCDKGGVDTRVDVWLEWIDAEMRKGCAEGLRSACDEEQGIIPPARYDPPPPPDAGPEAAPASDGGASGGDGESAGGGGCDCTVAPPAGAATLAPPLLLWLLAGRRRRR